MMTLQEIEALMKQAMMDPELPLPDSGKAGTCQPLVELMNALLLENRALRREHSIATGYIRRKVDQLLTVIGTVPLRPEELDNETLISIDPIGIVSEAFRRILSYSRITNERLHLAMEENQVVFEVVGGGILVLDCEKQILSCNRKFQDMFGQEEELALGRTCRDLVCQADNPEVCVFDVMMRTGQVSANLFYCCHNGQHYNVVASPVKDAKGNIVRVVLLYNDITELVAAKAAVAEEKERLFFTLASIAEGVIATDENGRISLMNRIAEELTGWSSQEAAGRAVCDVFRAFAEDKRPICLDIVGSALGEEESGKPAGRTILRSREGGERLCTMSTAPILRKDTTVAGAIVVFRDITREKMLEEEMVKTARLESLGQLAGGIAHDFNNLLTAMLGNVSLAKILVERGTKVHELLSRTENASSRAKNLTQQLLTFAKGGGPMKSLLSMERVLRESVDFSLSGSTVRCECVFSGILWPVEADAGQLGQVIQNLVLNAVQAMPDGGAMQIGAENFLVEDREIPSLNRGKYVRITVKDQGRGIPRQDIDKIFDPYFTTKELGHGLGLTICYSIIRKHQGHISVESEPGVGTTFFLYLPASEKKLSVETAPVVEKKEDHGPGRGRILVMDDEEVVRDVVSQMIAFLGYQVDLSRDGEETLVMYARAMDMGRPYDVVIMDLTIPGGLGGKEAIDKVLAIDPEARVVVSSGYANDPIMADFRRYGFSGVVPKPYSMQELARVLEAVQKEPSAKY